MDFIPLQPFKLETSSDEQLMEINESNETNSDMEILKNIKFESDDPTLTTKTAEFASINPITTSQTAFTNFPLSRSYLYNPETETTTRSSDYKLTSQSQDLREPVKILETKSSSSSRKEIAAEKTTEREAILQDIAIPTTRTSHDTAALDCKTSSSRIELGELKTFGSLSGHLINREDEEQFQGMLPLSAYPINDDPNPQHIRKSSSMEAVHKRRQVKVRYLRPLTPEPHGAIVIKEEHSRRPEIAPPIILRQTMTRAGTPSPIVLRETPPRIRARQPGKLITIKGKMAPPRPRQIIVERMAPLPPNPQSIIVERWLAPREPPRQVIYKKSDSHLDQTQETQHNVIIEVDAPKMVVKTEYIDLGVVKGVDANEYTVKYGASLKNYDELPDFAKQVEPPSTMSSSKDKFSHKGYQDSRVKLEGDLEALTLIDLEAENLTEYAHLVASLRSSGQRIKLPETFTLTTSSSTLTASELEKWFVQCVDELNIDRARGVSEIEAKEILRKLNDKLGREYNEIKCLKFIRSVNVKSERYMNFSVFMRAVLENKYYSE